MFSTKAFYCCCSARSSAKARVGAKGCSEGIGVLRRAKLAAIARKVVTP
jgi:hypothetical protein